MTEVPCFSILWSWSSIRAKIGIITSTVVFFLVIKSAWNSKFLPDLVPAKTIVSYPFFISNRLLICQGLGWNHNAFLITFSASSNLGGYGFFTFSRVASFYFELNIVFLLEARKNDGLGKTSVDTNSASNSSSTTLLLLNPSKKSLFLFNNIDVRKSKPRSMLLSMRILVWGMRLLIGCIRLLLQSR